MVDLAIILGVYSYLILSLGLIGKLEYIPVLIVTAGIIIFSVIWFKKKIKFGFKDFIKTASTDQIVKYGLLLLGLQVIVNFIGAISPELSFDALWYHLTSAKFYVGNHRVFYLPGWLLWPANIPRFTEMLYSSALLLSGDILAKLVSFIFGLLSLKALFNLLRRYLNLRNTVLGLLTFYTMLIIGWQSTTAYADLSRLFFEILALDLFLKWYETKKGEYLSESAIMTGLAISTKILAFGSLFSFGILIFLLKGKDWIKNGLKYLFITLLTVSPWLILSYINVGNPLFPLFGSVEKQSVVISGPGLGWLIDHLINLPRLLWNSTFSTNDIISPIYLIFLPVVLIKIWKENVPVKITALFVLTSLLFVPVVNTGNRYLIPYLAMFTLVVISVLENSKYFVKKVPQYLLLLVIFVSSVLSMGSRALATRKFIPYVTGRETKIQFLAKNLNFSYGDFYDVDGWFAKNISKDDLVLIYDVHNLYYVNFPFVHESMAKPGTYFTHVLVGSDKKIPEKLGKHLLIYYNPLTKVRVYIMGEKYK